ncbi:MAG TPA: alpha-amylase family glycosyl hydrolase [Dermatophilaceae bacterium]|nr:alpha-amylase family glycosyl hydrolase [Dermatophilaceae bacterium]
MSWLADAVFYQIYPQSFADSDGDGVGDFPGVLAHLDHLAWLGVNAIWFNPCFASPFRDAGYDVSDYLRVAPRYGTNEDLVAVVDAARERGIRVVLDLVAGHTSVEHDWFQAALAGDGLDRYVWADRPGDRLVPVSERRWYLKNFYDEQPALNFGYARADPDQPWRQPVDAPGPMRNRAALREVMAYWLDRGVSGFRVDMAFSLVKDDPGWVETVRLWQELRAWLDRAYPDAVLIPEGFEPSVDGPPAFDADFLLVIDAVHGSLFDNGAAGSLPWVAQGPCYFDEAGCGSPRTFLDLWRRRTAELGGDRLTLLASADHDYSRLAMGSRSGVQLGTAWTFLLTWPSIPSVYYGEEIGMRYLPGLPDVEGSVVHATYNRAGCRTPMQWDGTANAGFSAAPAADLYLPVDPDPSRPNVAAQRDDPASVLHLVRDLIALRRATPELSPRASLRLLGEGYPLAYLRGEQVLVVVNPSATPASLALPEDLSAVAWTPLHGTGVGVAGGRVEVARFGHGVLRRS